MRMLVPTAEAARRLQMTRERVRQLLEHGSLAGCRIEGRDRARYVHLEGEGGEHDRVLISIQEAARRAEVTPATIRSWIESGRLEAYRIEGDRRVYVSTE